MCGARRRGPLSSRPSTRTYLVRPRLTSITSGAGDRFSGEPIKSGLLNYVSNPVSDPSIVEGAMPTCPVVPAMSCLRTSSRR